MGGVYLHRLVRPPLFCSFHANVLQYTHSTVLTDNCSIACLSAETWLALVGLISKQASLSPSLPFATSEAMASTVPAQQQQTPPPLLPGFDRLSKLVYLYRPDETTTTTSPPSTSPKLILIAGWMDAREAHLAKYTTKYQALFPGVPILLVRNFAYHFTPGRRAKAFPAEMAAAVPVIESFFLAGSEVDASTATATAPTPELLVHAFSNGGATALRHVYAQSHRQPAASRLPRRVTVLDSAPGRFHYARSIHAFSVGVPYATTPLLRFLVLRLAIHVLCASYWVFQLVFGRRRGALDRTFEAHNDVVLVGGRDEEVRRTYIYSREDRMIDYRDVEEHAAEARRRRRGAGEEDEEAGVRVEKFEGTAHVAHVRGDEDRYWKVVKETWEGQGR